MEKNFYVFRHGQTDLNVKGIWQGTSVDAPLNDNGFAQAEQLGKKLQNLGLEEIYASPMLRARQTAEQVNKSVNVKIHIANDLHECSFGDAEGKDYDTVGKEYPDVMYDYLHPTPQTWDKKYPGNPSESKKEAYLRISKAILQIAQNTDKTTIGIATHGGAMSALLAGLDSFGIDLPNCCVAKITYDEDNHKLAFAQMI